jgi:uncharacterized membrane protein
MLVCPFRSFPCRLSSGSVEYSFTLLDWWDKEFAVRKTTLRFSIRILLLGVIVTLLDTATYGQDLRSIWVAHRRVDCIGVAPQKCYLIKSTQYEDWRFWYSEIEGFDFEEGYAYELLVREVPVEDPPADGSSVKLELVEVLLKVEAFERPDASSPPSTPVAPAPAEPETVDVEPAAPPAPVEPETVDVEPPAPVEPAPVTVHPAPVPPPPAPAESPTPKTGKLVELTPEPPAPAAPPAAAPAPRRPAVRKGEEVKGHLSIGAGIEARSFKVCGAEESIWVEDRTDIDLWSVYRDMTQFPNRALFMVVRGEIQDPPPSGFGAHYPQQLLIYDLRHVATESAGCFDDLSRLQFRASGNEPSWNLEISQRGLAFTEMGREGRTLFPFSPPTFTNGRVIYQSQTGGNVPRSIVVRLDEQPCLDTMADARFSYSAMVEVDGRTLAGCALEGGSRP